MKLVKQKVEYIPQLTGIHGIKRKIEQCGRIAYKTEDKACDVLSVDLMDFADFDLDVKDFGKLSLLEREKLLVSHKKDVRYISTAPQFVDNLIKKGHYSVLEHGTVHLKIPTQYNKPEFYTEVSSFVIKSKYTVHKMGEDCWYITTNYREIVKHHMEKLLEFISDEECCHTDERYTMFMQCSRSTAQQVTRHRAFSFTMESQRYCNYANAKFGHEITFMIPKAFDTVEEGSYKNLPDHSMSPMSLFQIRNADTKQMYDNVTGAQDMLQALAWCEHYYFKLIELGMKPEDARCVLPNCTKTELVMTGYRSDWEEFFKQRLDNSTGKTDSDMKSLAELMFNEFKNNGIKI